MIGSHYAEPAKRVVAAPAPLRATASDEGKTLAELAPGEPFALLDERAGWAWGYAGCDRRVGYVRSEALGLAD